MKNETQNLLHGTLNCIDFIKSELNKAKKKSNSNSLELDLIRAKNKAFDRINDTTKPAPVAIASWSGLLTLYGGTASLALSTTTMLRLS